MGPPTCVLCLTEAATVFCVNDDANLCAACDVKAHSGNPLAARHERRAIAPAPQESHSSACCGSASLSGAWPLGSETSADDAAVVPQWRPAARDGSQEGRPRISLDLVRRSMDLRRSLDLGRRSMDLPLLDFDLADIPLGCADALRADLDLADCGIVPVFEGAGLNAPPADDVEALLGMFPLDASPEAGLESAAGLGGSCQTALMHGSAAAAADAPAQLVPVAPASRRAAGASRRAISAIAAGSARRAGGSSAATGARRAAARSAVRAAAAAAAAEEPELTREQRVARYLEKRKRRNFTKTIRYASRKAYAEVRPRIKGRFVKPHELAAYMASQGAAQPEAEAVVPTC